MATQPIPPVLDRMFRVQPGEFEGRMATIDGLTPAAERDR